MLRLIPGWIAAGRRVTLVLGIREGAAAIDLPDGCDIVTIGDARYSAVMRALPGIVRRLRPDAVFCPGNHYTGMAAWLRLRLGRETPPIVAKLSNALVRPDMGPVVAWGYRRWLSLHRVFLDAMVAMTPAMRVEALRAIDMSPQRVRVIANPPTLGVPDAAPFALPEGRLLLGVGRLAPQKRWDRVIAALPQLADTEIPLVILGEGAERAALEALIADLGLQDRVSLPGHAADPLPAIARATLVVLASDYEGVPGVLREAAAEGTPVVTSDSSVAVREIVGDPASGSIVPVGDAAALVTAIDAWLVPGRTRPAAQRASGDPAAEYLALFDELVAGRATPTPAAASSPA